MRSPRCAPLLLLLLLCPLLLTPPTGDAAIITGACDKDTQCGGGTCCAVSIWVKSIRICTPMGKVGDACHPLTRKLYRGTRYRRCSIFLHWELSRYPGTRYLLLPHSHGLCGAATRESQGSILWAENASHLSMSARLGLFTDFI
ncbi:prokineticin-2 isoform X1 [Tamandua tetradactyla]|uniref:prokineticin-2 isoform X1 n=1 Tax=Tamandua tetradactyla TaxID=48850 RepID=UPI004053FE6B